MRRILLAGEGKTELGEWAKEREYRETPGERGVLEALLRRVGGDQISIVDGIVWTKIVKYRAGNHASPETRNVLGVALKARERRCDAVAFSRDRDEKTERQLDIEEGIQRAVEVIPEVTIMGGVAVENIEGWVLVLLGVTEGERIPSKRTKAELEKRFGVVTLQQKVEAVDSAEIDSLPEGSVHSFVHRVRVAFATVGEMP